MPTTIREFICKNCGCRDHFRRSHVSRDLKQFYDNWADRNADLCFTCFTIDSHLKAMERAREFGLPRLESESYELEFAATYMRDVFVFQTHRKEFEVIKLQPDRAVVAAAYCSSPKHSFKRIGTVLTSNDAWKVRAELLEECNEEEADA